MNLARWQLLQYMYFRNVPRWKNIYTWIWFSTGDTHFQQRFGDNNNPDDQGGQQPLQQQQNGLHEEQNMQHQEEQNNQINQMQVNPPNLNPQVRTCLILGMYSGGFARYRWIYLNGVGCTGFDLHECEQGEHVKSEPKMQKETYSVLLTFFVAKWFFYSWKQDWLSGLCLETTVAWKMLVKCSLSIECTQSLSELKHDS